VERATIERVLVEGEISVHGRIQGSSNAALLVTVVSGDDEVVAVYKPERGERPLWDFPAGLWRREVAAYRLSLAFDHELVPVTVLREEGPFGAGALQAFIDEDGTSHYFTLREEPERADWLQTLAAFDVVANNSDRKSGHVLARGADLFGIDHGLCFHAEPKLRTVIWDWSGAPLTADARSALERIERDRSSLGLDPLLNRAELAALDRRVRDLLEADELPSPDEDAPWPPYPWPLV
jgi:uncharacterized repeat protein (TIGR03843 family)